MSEDKPLAIDLYCGLGGWAEGFLAEGYRVVGFDIERHDYGTGGYPGQLVLQDALTIDGSQFKDAAVIVASPPCQNYSYMAMPWSRAKELIKDYEASAERRAELTALFDNCFRLQREASEAAGRHIPLIVENVRGAQRWVGRAKWHFGSYYLWGDLPALMPNSFRGIRTSGRSLDRNAASKWGPHNMGTAEQIMSELDQEGTKEGGDWWNKECRKTGMARFGSQSDARRAASAAIAKIPFPLAHHIAKCFAGELRFPSRTEDAASGTDDPRPAL